MMTANDYGHKAKATTQAIETVLEKNGVTFRSLTARKDSAKVDLEAGLKPTIEYFDRLLAEG